MYECIECGQISVVKDGEYERDDVLVRICHCTHCGAQITVETLIDDDTGGAWIDDVWNESGRC